jgi:hypothetical protein
VVLRPMGLVRDLAGWSATDPLTYQSA